MAKTEVNAHIPYGFRCSTKAKMIKVHGATLLFDNGFFSPYSIKKLLSIKYININLENTVPCIKIEGYMENNKKGIKFVELQILTFLLKR